MSQLRKAWCIAALLGSLTVLAVQVAVALFLAVAVGAARSDGPVLLLRVRQRRRRVAACDWSFVAGDGHELRDVDTGEGQLLLQKTNVDFGL